jgi:cytoskeletal protein RodZ
MKYKNILIGVLLIISLLNINVLYANDIETQETDENERVITSIQEKKEVRLEINESLEKKEVNEQENTPNFQQDKTTSKITSYISFGSSAVIFIVFIFIFVFILNIYFTIKKK